MTAQVLRAKEAGADVILTYAIGPELAQIANAMGKLGWKVPMVGSWTLSMASFLDGAGKNGEGATMPQTFIQQPSTPKRKAFIDAYKAAYKVDRMPSPVSAAQGYDSVYLISAAITQAKSTEGPKIRAALENLDQKIEGVVTVYDKPFSEKDHEAISANIPVFGVVKDGRVVAAHPEDLAGRQGDPDEIRELTAYHPLIPAVAGMSGGEASACSRDDNSNPHRGPPWTSSAN